MLFNSYNFILFFPIVTLIYFLVPSGKFRRAWLLVASYFFYMCWNAKYILLILFVTIVTYITAIIVSKQRFGESGEPTPESVSKENKNGKVAMAIGVIASLSVLFVFKYFDMAVDTLNGFLSLIHVTAVNNPFSLVLPVGISFYTFQALGYVVDVYRGKTKVEKNFIRFALFVSFFPQLVAGPIERSDNLLKQINTVPDKKNLFDADRIVRGFYLMLWGMFLKVVIADRLAKVADTVFGTYKAYGSLGLIIGICAFSVQVYCDFSSYSLIAIGSARVMGFSLMENFNTPLLSRTVSEYWRRWHISMSTWFRDYVYISLGGSRCSKRRKYINNILTFMASGLWHGASWNYVVWGALFGVYQVCGQFTRPYRNKLEDKLHINRDTLSYKIYGVIGTNFWINNAIIIFRSESLKDAAIYIYRMLTKWDVYALFDPNAYDFGITHIDMNILIVALLALLVTSIIKYKKGLNIDEFVSQQNIAFKFLFVFILVMALLIYGIYGPQLTAADYVYFQF